MSIPNFDPDLISRHNVNGTRNTSYPTADQFRDGPWTDAYEQPIAATNIRAVSFLLFEDKREVELALLVRG